MRYVLLTIAGLAVIGLIGAGAVIGFGLFNVSARMGHLPGISWVLHTTFRNSVRLRAPDAAAVPMLTDEMAAIGARHYDSACRPCHAAPGERQTWTMRSMEPAPPHITKAVEGWEPRHLFWISLNGVKMTGMPHWPAKQRQDEVWMMTAFLARIGTLGPGEYAELIAPPAADNPLVAYCATCHGLDGAGR
ncbi:MAG TPA: cytochrome c, partial [Paracoccaceae bacterium]|nr:cytochrome c [Paracoccaceae bacterium]